MDYGVDSFQSFGMISSQVRDFDYLELGCWRRWEDVTKFLSLSSGPALSRVRIWKIISNVRYNSRPNLVPILREKLGDYMGTDETSSTSDLKKALISNDLYSFKSQRRTRTV